MNVALDRLRRQKLVGAPLANPEDVVAWLGAVQAQDYAGAKWGVGLRCARSTDAALDAACDAGAILRTHVLRPTWHFVRPADLRWMLALTAPRVHRANALYYRRRVGDARAFAKADHLLVRALAGAPHTRAELGALLDASDMRLTYLVMHAELEGLIVSGPRRGKQATWMLVDERVPPARAPSDPLGELARRYLASRGPATARDFAWWSGLDAKTARAGIEATRADSEGDYFFLGAARGRVAAPVAHLLPNYDELRVGYRRGASLDRTFPHDLVIDGEVAGSWRRIVGARKVRVELRPSRRTSAAERDAIDAAVDRYRRFLAVDLECAPRWR